MSYSFQTTHRLGNIPSFLRRHCPEKSGHRNRLAPEFHLLVQQQGYVRPAPHWLSLRGSVMTERAFEYAASICYAREGEPFLPTWAMWISQVVEGYRTFPALSSDQTQEDPPRARRVATYAVLPDAGSDKRTVLESIGRSEVLIVLCTAGAAADEQLCSEIHHYLSNGGENVIPVILSGVPDGADASLECVPALLRNQPGWPAFEFIDLRSCHEELPRFGAALPEASPAVIEEFVVDSRDLLEKARRELVECFGQREVRHEVAVLEPTGSPGTARPAASTSIGTITGMCADDEEPQQAPTTPIYPPENVQFTVYRPKYLSLKWQKMLVFTHLDDSPDDDAVESPLEEVRREAAQTLGNKAQSYQDITKDSKALVPRESDLTIIPRADNVRFNPPSRSFTWVDDITWHKEEFQVAATPQAMAALGAGPLTGTVTVYLGLIILAEIPLKFMVGAEATATPAPLKSQAKAFRNIFPSYSHRDNQVVEQIEAYAMTMGDRYLRDVTTLRAGQDWNAQLKTLISKADVFQLFWSRNAAASSEVEKEWRFALSLNRAEFVRPTCWEDPFPEIHPDLGAIHCQKLNLRVPVPEMPPGFEPAPSAPLPPQEPTSHERRPVPALSPPPPVQSVTTPASAAASEFPPPSPTQVPVANHSPSVGNSSSIPRPKKRLPIWRMISSAAFGLVFLGMVTNYLLLSGSNDGPPMPGPPIEPDSPPPKHDPGGDPGPFPSPPTNPRLPTPPPTPTLPQHDPTPTPPPPPPGWTDLEPRLEKKVQEQMLVKARKSLTAQKGIWDKQEVSSEGPGQVIDTPDGQFYRMLILSKRRNAHMKIDVQILIEAAFDNRKSPEVGDVREVARFPATVVKQEFIEAGQRAKAIALTKSAAKILSGEKDKTPAAEVFDDPFVFRGTSMSRAAFLETLANRKAPSRPEVPKKLAASVFETTQVEGLGTQQVRTTVKYLDPAGKPRALTLGIFFDYLGTVRVQSVE